MRYHLGLAALILVGGIVAGWWFSRGSAAPTTPIGIRNSIATNDSVVVSYSRAGGAANGATTITFLKGKGWIWQQPGSAASGGTVVIVASSHALMAAAPGCYIAIPNADAPNAPVVPGVNLVRDLNSAPGLKQDGAIYTYQVAGDNGIGGLHVSEDLGGIATTQSYRATVTVIGSPGQGNANVQPGVYTVQRATAAERDAAERMLSQTKASPVAAFTVKQRLLKAGAPTQAGGIAMVSPEGCPGALAINPDVLGTNASPLFFSMANPRATLGVSVTTKGNEVFLAGIVVVDQPFDAATDVLLGAIGSAPQTAPIREGLTFSLPSTGASGGTPALMSIADCHAEAWFPC